MHASMQLTIIVIITEREGRRGKVLWTINYSAKSTSESPIDARAYHCGPRDRRNRRRTTWQLLHRGDYAPVFLTPSVLREAHESLPGRRDFRVCAMEFHAERSVLAIDGRKAGGSIEQRDFPPGGRETARGSGS